MKITTETNTYSAFNLVATRNEYDALPPVDTLQIDFAPVNINPDRLAIASYLAFGAYCSGGFELNVKFSPAAAEAIEQDAKPVQLRPAPIEYYPKALAIGMGEAAVSFSLPGESHKACIAVLPSDKYNGLITGHNQLIISSNAFFLDAVAQNAYSIRARLAVAVLFAEDLGIDTLTVDGSTIDTTERQSLVRLLTACRLGLTFS